MSSFATGLAQRDCALRVSMTWSRAEPICLPSLPPSRAFLFLRLLRGPVRNPSSVSHLGHTASQPPGCSVGVLSNLGVRRPPTSQASWFSAYVCTPYTMYLD